MLHCFFRSEFMQKLTASMAANTKLPLTSLNVSGNLIEEKGFIQYSRFVTKFITINLLLNNLF